MICNLQSKIDILWKFLTTQCNGTTLVLFTSSNQAYSVYEIFRNLNPCFTMQYLYIDMKHQKKLMIYHSSHPSTHIVNFTTDAACRGLDFTRFNWIVQVDCLNTFAQYIHYVGKELG